MTPVVDGRIHRQSIARDLLFLVSIVVLSSLPYIGGLGFYSDDWSFLGLFALSADQSLPGLYQSVNSPHVEMRPVQILYVSTLYWLMGDQPLGYHIVNLLVLVSAVVFFYLSLIRLGLPRVIAICVPLVWGLLPNYSTDRFWYLAFQANLSVALYFVSLFADVTGVVTVGLRRWLWKGLSIVCFVLAALAYEVVIPLFLLNVIVVGIWLRRHRRTGTEMSASPAPLHAQLSYLVPSVIALVALGVFKLLTTTRQGDASGLDYYAEIIKLSLRTDYERSWYGLNLWEALDVNYGEYVIQLPFVTWTLMRDATYTQAIGAGLIVGFIVYGYIVHALRTVERDDLVRSGRLLFVAGPIIFVAGYAIFLTNYNVQFTPTGIGNRTAIAAAIGVAFSVVGLASWLVSPIRSRRLRQHLLAGTIAFVCLCSVVIVGTLGQFWGTAWEAEQRVLKDLDQAVPTLPPGSTVILDGVCPYIGPAIVFESSWDLAGALWVRRGDGSLRADVASPSLSISDDALETELYGTVHRYPYGDHLFIVNVASGDIYTVTDASVARRYVETVTPNNVQACPGGLEGHGVPVL